MACDVFAQHWVAQLTGDFTKLVPQHLLASWCAKKTSLTKLREAIRALERGEAVEVYFDEDDPGAEMFERVYLSAIKSAARAGRSIQRTVIPDGMRVARID